MADATGNQINATAIFKVFTPFLKSFFRALQAFNMFSPAGKSQKQYPKLYGHSSAHRIGLSQL